MVLHQHPDDLDALLHGGRQFGGHHQIRAVADHDEHVAIGGGQAHPDPAGDLVSHAREAVFDVVALAVTGAPQLVQVTGHRSGGAHHHVARVGQRVDQPDDLVLVQRRVVADPDRGVDGGVPLVDQFGGARAVFGAHRVAGQGFAQRLERLARIGDDGQAALLDRIERGHIDVDEAHVGIVERGPRGGGEVAVAGADADDDVGLGGQGVGGGGAGGPDGADGLRVIVRQGSLAGLRLADGDAGAGGEAGQGLVGVGVDDPAAGDDQRRGGRPDEVGGAVEHRALGQRPPDVPGALGEQRDRPVERLRLDVLRQSHCRGAGFARVGEHPHGAQQRGGQLLGAPYPVEVARQRLEGVVDGDVAAAGQLQFLQHRRADAGGEGVRRQQQHRQPVDGGQGRAGEHVGGARSDAGGHGPGLQPVALARVGDRAVHHGLFVAAQHVSQPRRGPGGVGLDLVLQQRLPDAGDVAVAEDAEATGEEPVPVAVALDVLVGQEADRGLGDGEPDPGFGVGELVGGFRRGGNHGHAPRVPAAVKGRRGSTCWCSQLPRSQVWSGSSQIRHARSGPEPAITLR